MSGVIFQVDLFLRDGTGGGFGIAFTIIKPHTPLHHVKVRQWCQDSSDHFFSLAFSSESSEAGVSLVSGFQLTDNDQGARVMWEWAGIRPQRDTIRLEQEILTTSKGKQLKVVHNYGHRSFGISLSWGTAVHAAKLVHDLLLDKTPPAAKL